MKIVGPQKAYENLANAIIKLAADDYKSALIRLKRNPGSEGAKRDVERLEKFFYSEWFEILTNLEPSYLIRRIKEIVNMSKKGEKK